MEILYYVKGTIFCFLSTMLLSPSAGTFTADANSQRSDINDSVPAYRSANLVLLKLSAHTYQHISYLSTNDFGKVDCNGMIVVNENEAVVFDTPATEESTDELINYVIGKLGCRIVAVIPTHFHEDCVAGLDRFFAKGVPAYASAKTISFLSEKRRIFSKPLNSFSDNMSLKVGDKVVYVGFFGEGHTRDNVVGYFPDDNAVFGGCLIKENGANKGNLAEANIEVWPATVRKVRDAYKYARIVIPGHGKTGGSELFDYTIRLFQQ